jgi:hypothetical protein
MSKRNLFFTLGFLCVIASFVMYMVGNNSSHLSELKDFWWIPLPLGALLLLVATKKK